MNFDQRRSLGEELFSSISHGIAVPLCIVGLLFLFLFSKSHTIWENVGFSVFGGTLIFMYLMSTLFHALSFTKARKVFLALDQSSIFLLIAGTYTPFILIMSRNITGWIILVLVWLLAVVGITLKSIFIEKLETFSLVLYLSMGWLSIFLIVQIFHRVPLQGFIYLLVGGVLYTVGAVMYRMKKIPYNHAIWHGLVIMASACHYALMFYL